MEPKLGQLLSVNKGLRRDLNHLGCCGKEGGGKLKQPIHQAEVEARSRVPQVLNYTHTHTHTRKRERARNECHPPHPELCAWPAAHGGAEEPCG